MYQRIFVPTDGSSIADRGLEEAIAIGRYTQARLHVLHVVDDLPIAGEGIENLSLSGTDIIGMVTDEGKEILAAARERVQQAGLNCDTTLRRTSKGRIYEQILQVASTWKADLVVIGTHGRTGAERLFMGSDAEQIVRHANIPVLLVRQNEDVD
jgi:nucleotide-binding universal stress UspA family protein